VSAEIVDLAARRPAAVGNGAREALEAIFWEDQILVDGFLAKLAMRGFKVVPLDDADFE
jgi:hypothetical protein